MTRAELVERLGRSLQKEREQLISTILAELDVLGLAIAPREANGMMLYAAQIAVSAKLPGQAATPSFAYGARCWPRER